MAKGGAEGYHASAALRRAIGLCAKVIDGNSRAVPPFVVTALQNENAISAEQAGLLSGFRRKAVTNRAGTVTGEIYAEIGSSSPG